MAVIGGFLALVITIAFMFALRPVAVELGFVDIPGGRKRHDAKVPLIGGVAMAIGLGFGSSVVPQPDIWWTVLLAFYLLVFVGVIDDRYDLPAGVRLIAQSAAALLAIFGADLLVGSLGPAFFAELGLGIFALPFTLLLILTVVNAFNVIDGIDGLAGSTALVALAGLAVVGFGGELFVVTLLLVSVVCGFLLFNLPLPFNRPVRAFMGDAGSTALGLAIAVIGIALSQGAGAVMAPVIGLWLIAVPVFDLFCAIVRRVAERRSPFEPDHEHLHHVLIEHGLSRRAALAVMLALALLFASIGLAGHVAKVADGMMLVGWFAAGTTYYRLMRHPRAVVALVALLGGRLERPAETI
jgi:UDP-GlcNAc:undecaprenyl-phosphate/decaprenyl-phosphate GlcNAc-1-phosphate transferase